MHCLRPRPSRAALPGPHGFRNRAESAPTWSITPGPACRAVAPTQRPRGTPTPLITRNLPPSLAVPWAHPSRSHPPSGEHATQPTPRGSRSLSGYICEPHKPRNRTETKEQRPSQASALNQHHKQSKLLRLVQIDRQSIVVTRFSFRHGDHRRGAASRPARKQQRHGVRGRKETVRGGQERGLRHRRRRHRTGIQGAGGGVAAGGGVQEEHGPVCKGEGRGRAVREGEHGRGAVPAEGGPEDVRRVRGAQGRAGEALRRLLQLRQGGRRLRRRLRGQGRRPHARRRRPMGHVHLLLQEAEDNEGL